MYDKTEIRILEQIYLKPGIHKRELSKQLKIGMPSIDYAFKKIEKILKKKKSGNQIKYYLDYSKYNLIPTLYSIEYSRFNKLPTKIRLSIKDFIKELKEKPLMIILFGSYAEKTYTKHSDIDLLLVYQKVTNAKSIEYIAKKINMRTNVKINPIYLSYSKFKKSFHDLTKKFFKNLKMNKIILEGVGLWRQLKDEEA